MSTWHKQANQSSSLEFLNVEPGRLDVFQSLSSDMPYPKNQVILPNRNINNHM